MDGSAIVTTDPSIKPIAEASMVAARTKCRDAARQGEVVARVKAACPSGQIGLSMITNASSIGHFAVRRTHHGEERAQSSVIAKQPVRVL